jgi:hypothetical protein
MPNIPIAPDFWQFLASMGVGGVLAAYAFYINNKNQTEHTEVIKGYHEVEQGRTEMLVGIIKENTVCTSTNNSLLDALHRRLDRDEYERKNGIK